MKRLICKIFGCNFPSRDSIWIGRSKITSLPCERCGVAVVTHLKERDLYLLRVTASTALNMPDIRTKQG